MLSLIIVMVIVVFLHLKFVEIKETEHKIKKNTIAAYVIFLMAINILFLLNIKLPNELILYALVIHCYFTIPPLITNYLRLQFYSQDSFYDMSVYDLKIKFSIDATDAKKEVAKMAKLITKKTFVLYLIIIFLQVIILLENQLLFQK